MTPKMKPNTRASTVSGTNTSPNTSPGSTPPGSALPCAGHASPEGIYRDRVREVAKQVRDDNREILNRLAKK